MAENHGLADRDGAVNVAQGPVLVFLAVALDVILLDVVQRLLFSPQSDDDGFVGYDFLGKLHHRLIVGGREQQHLTLVAVQLSGNQR
jgi:hypothetical protein